MRRERRRASRWRAVLAGGAALLVGGLVVVTLLRSDEEAPRRATRSMERPAVATRAATRVAPVERPRPSPTVDVAAPRPAVRPEAVAPEPAAQARTPSQAVASVATPVDAARPAQGPIAPKLEARAERAERRLAALEKREASARRFARMRRELELDEDGPEAESLRILLGDDSPFRGDAE